MNKPKKRFWELDYLRGFAILSVLFGHLIYDLRFFGGFDAPNFWPTFRMLVFIIPPLFLLLVGISLTLSYSKINQIFFI